MARIPTEPARSVAASTMSTCSVALKLLADETRLAVVEQLLAGPRRVHEINSELNIDATLLSHHLRVLREAGLINADREGRTLLYRLSPDVRLAQKGRSLDFGCCRLSFPRPVSKKYSPVGETH